MDWTNREWYLNLARKEGYVENGGKKTLKEIKTSQNKEIF